MLLLRLGWLHEQINLCFLTPVSVGENKEEHYSPRGLLLLLLLIGISDSPINSLGAEISEVAPAHPPAFSSALANSDATHWALKASSADVVIQMGTGNTNRDPWHCKSVHEKASVMQQLAQELSLSRCEHCNDPPPPPYRLTHALSSASTTISPLNRNCQAAVRC